MTASITAAAHRIGYATFGAQPCGLFISLDGINPNDAGHRILAQAALQDINGRYRVPRPTPRRAAAN